MILLALSFIPLTAVPPVGENDYLGPFDVNAASPFPGTSIHDKFHDIMFKFLSFVGRFYHSLWSNCDQSNLVQTAVKNNEGKDSNRC